MKKVTTNLAFEAGFTSALCETVGSPRALMVNLLVQNGEWEQLASLEIDANHYNDVESFADDYLVTEIMRKSDSLPLDIDRESECKALFNECESRNAETNARFRFGARHPDWFYTVQKEFQTILGPLSKAVLERIVRSCRFGPGVAVGVKAAGLVPSIKYDSHLSLTPSLIPFVRSLMGELWWQHNSSYREVVRGNEFFTVPKNAKSFRGCCKEPSLNSYGQLGIGEHLANRLRFFGVDIRDQGKNQHLAKLAWSREGATIDLSNASNLLARRPVEELSTPEWGHLFSLFRSPSVLIDGEWKQTEMMSSMGNGFNFPLQSAVFLAVVRSLVPEDRRAECAVYGDDIVCPREYARSVIDRLEYLGLQVNSKKTNLAGSFFESCGADFFRGVNVRPFYLRREQGSDTQIPYHLQTANALRIYANRRGYGEFCDSRYLPLWKDLIRGLPPLWKKTKVPASFGDTGIIVSTKDRSLKAADKFGRFAQNEGFTAWFIRSSSIFQDRQTMGVLLAAYTNGDATETATRGREPTRGLFGRPILSKAITVWSPGFDWA